MSHAVEGGNADMSFADDDKSIGSSIANDKVLDERPLELSDAIRIDFLGNGQELLCSYNPCRMTMERSGTLLADNETLIGVYGAFSKEENF